MNDNRRAAAKGMTSDSDYLFRPNVACNYSTGSFNYSAFDFGFMSHRVRAVHLN